MAALTQAVRTRTAAGHQGGMMVQELSAVAANQARATVGTQAASMTSQVITPTTLAQAQLVAAQRIPGTLAATSVTQPSAAIQHTTTRTLTPAQLNFLKAQALLKQQEQQKLRQQNKDQLAKQHALRRIQVIKLYIQAKVPIL